jgi:hypothetical protein
MEHVIKYKTNTEWTSRVGGGLRLDNWVGLTSPGHKKAHPLSSPVEAGTFGWGPIAIPGLHAIDSDLLMTPSYLMIFKNHNQEYTFSKYSMRSDISLIK